MANPIQMTYRRLGKTGLMVSVISLGTGGPNRFGQKTSQTQTDITALVRNALDRGVNLFDTAAGYEQSERLLGNALKGIPRDRYILATKYRPSDLDPRRGPDGLRNAMLKSLDRLNTDRIDIVQLHRIGPWRYRHSIERMLPALIRLREQGYCRFIGITESTRKDPRHRVIETALADRCFDTVMVAYSPDNPSAGGRVLNLAAKTDVGVIAMASARSLVAGRDRFASPKERVRHLAGLFVDPPSLDVIAGSLKRIATDRRNTQSHLSRRNVCPAVGYRFAASHPVVATVLTGTTNSDHLEQNIRAAVGQKDFFR